MEIIQSIQESLGIDWQVVIAQAISFLVLILLLLKFMFKPIESIFKQRQEQVAKNIAEAEEQREHAASLRQLYEGHLANIADEARAKMDQIVKDADVQTTRMVDAANVEIHDLQERNRKQMALDYAQMRQQLREEVSNIAVTAATKVLRTQITPEMHSSIIDQVIRDMDIPAGKLQ